VELAAAMGSSSVVVGFVFSHDESQMSLAEDQHPVGDLGPVGLDYSIAPDQACRAEIIAE
jgi:hypothetical protein